MTKKQKRERKRILIALVIFAALLITEHSPAGEQIFSRPWTGFLLYLVPYLIVGWSVLRNAFRGILNRQMFDESFLMTVATAGAFATQQFAEACAVMLFYQIGEFFQDYAVNRSRGSITELMDLAPDFAYRETEDGEVEEVDTDDVEIGDILVIRPGEKVPVDGKVISGNSMLNTAALTGESVPRSVTAGDQIVSGCINGDGLLKMKAEKVYDDSTVAKILELVENASEKKSRTENFITRFARVYTPLVVLGAVLIAVIPSIAVGHPMTWIYRACTFLVISCPCALVISVPLAFFGGIGAASREGILVKGSNYLELMAKLDTVVSDKTGTLTKGSFRVTDVRAADGVEKEQLLKYASAAEALSTHPIAVSIRNAYGKNVSGEEVRNVENVTGQGVIADTVYGRVMAGNHVMMEKKKIPYEKAEDPESTIVYVAKDGVFQGSVLISDEVKPEAASAVDSMKSLGVKNVVMLTGDRKAAADAVGAKLGVDHTYAELLPGDKVEKVEELIRQEGEKGKLAFIGDGINDAPVLARADVGVAMGSMGSDAAIEAADIVIMDDDLRRIPAVIRIARRTVGISWQNIIFALAVKILILILAAFGLADMWAAVFADVGVAVLCILNSMRLLIKGKGDMETKTEAEIREGRAA